MKTRMIFAGFVIAVGIIAMLGITVFTNDSNKIIDSSSLEYLRALQELCKQNTNNDSVSIIDGKRWENATHFFDVPDCQFRKIVP